MDLSYDSPVKRAGPASLKYKADIISVNGGCDFWPLVVSLESAASLPLVMERRGRKSNCLR